MLRYVLDIHQKANRVAPPSPAFQFQTQLDRSERVARVWAALLPGWLLVRTNLACALVLTLGVWEASRTGNLLWINAAFAVVVFAAYAYPSVLVLRGGTLDVWITIPVRGVLLGFTTVSTAGFLTPFLDLPSPMGELKVPMALIFLNAGVTVLFVYSMWRDWIEFDPASPSIRARRRHIAWWAVSLVVGALVVLADVRPASATTHEPDPRGLSGALQSDHSSAFNRYFA